MLRLIELSDRANDALFFKTIPTFVTQSVRAPERAKVALIIPIIRIACI